MLGYIVRVNRESYVRDGGLTPDYFRAKVFNFEEIKEWLEKRIVGHEKLFKNNSLKDTDIELIMVEE